MSITLIFLLILTFFLYRLSKKENFQINKIIKLSLLDILIWFFQFFQITVIIKILNINIEFYEIIFIFGSALIAGLIPVSFGGFGVRDYVIFYFLNQINFSKDIFLVLLLFNLRYFLPVIVSLFISLISLRNDKKQTIK